MAFKLTEGLTFACSGRTAIKSFLTRHCAAMLAGDDSNDVRYFTNELMLRNELRNVTLGQAITEDSLITISK